MNKVLLHGNLTRDPEIRYAQKDGSAIANLTVAARDGYGNTEFVQCVAFKGKAEVAEKHLVKGSEVIVTGRWKNDTYADKETGEKKYSTKCIIDEIEFCGKKKQTEDSQPENGK